MGSPLSLLRHINGKFCEHNSHNVQGSTKNLEAIWEWHNCHPVKVRRTQVTHINNINEAIQFTVESEKENGEIPFLDTRVYKNRTNIGRRLTFHFCQSSATKQGIIKDLFLKAER